MTRIPRHVREQAALICAIAASNGHVEALSVRDVQAMSGVSEKSAKLAVRAWSAAHEGFLYSTYDVEVIRDEYAEAEAMLRTGWMPERGAK